MTPFPVASHRLAMPDPQLKKLIKRPELEEL
jgi:hypothetical protein